MLENPTYEQLRDDFSEDTAITSVSVFLFYEVCILFASNFDVNRLGVTLTMVSV
nr:MAG TPA: hypothetical protein [Herelleviridae sp.]